ncbi:MAG TPA: hypothetical protein PLX23_10235 [Candidatus Hydrogenedens sp.]|nr:hypothetical protein [Candidatus Hydrogenedens sp.]
MTTKSVKTRKEVLFIGALYLIPVLIVSGVFAVDLYINVQQWRYDCLMIQAKKNITKWVKNETEHIKSNENSMCKNASGVKALNNEELKDKSESSFFKYFIHEINYYMYSWKDNLSNNDNMDIQKEEDINCGLKAMMAEIEGLKVEKTKLENLQNLTRLGYQLGLILPTPEQIVRVTYSRDEREKLVQTVSTEMLFPEKPKKVEIISQKYEYAKEGSDVQNKKFRLLNNLVFFVKQKMMDKINTFVSAESRVHFPAQTQQVNSTAINNNSKNINPDKEKNDIDIDSLTKFLIEDL